MSKAMTCDICGEQDKRWFSNRYLLGCDDVLCWYCYLEWYDGGRTDREEIKHRSKLARYLASKAGGDR